MAARKKTRTSTSHKNLGSTDLKVLTGALVAAIAMVIIGFMFWWSHREKPIPPPVQVDAYAQNRTDVLNTLSNSTYVPSTEDRKRVLDQLNK
jgi:hypothetical protein